MGGLGGDFGFGLDLGANPKAHRPPGVEHDGILDDSANRPAMPYDALPGPQQAFPTCPLGRRQPAAACGVRPAGRPQSLPVPRPQLDGLGAPMPSTSRRRT